MTYDDGYRDGYDDEYADEYDDGQYERGRQERPVAADSESLLRRAIDIIATAPTFPLSSTPRIDRDEIVQLLEDALERLPEDLRTARWMLRERQEFIAKTRREAEEILESGRQQAERMVQRTEVARSAEARARQIVEVAESDARRLRNETEDFIDQSLARFEILLNRLNRAVATGRNNLNLGARDEVETPDAEDHSKGFFDQEQL